MRAVTIVDGDLVWQEHPDPVAGPGELLVAVRAAGINAADLLQRQGKYPAPEGVPADIPGMEFAGEVVGLGAGTSRFSLGDRVMSLVGGGAQAQLVVVPEPVVLPVPEETRWEEAGGFPEVFSTAHDALFTQARLRRGERVLVSGAAGGVGTAAVQLAHRAGAHVVASVRSPDCHADVAGLGADEVILPDAVGDHGPYDVSLELVGAPGVTGVLPHLASGARVVVIGVGAGAKLELNLLALMGRRATIGGSTLRSRTVAEKAAVSRAVEEYAVALLARGEVSVPLAGEFPITEATAAYEKFAAGGKFGKFVLVNS
ncbi:MAG: alcohol dehydrogenase catalytic domain-containing protein [Acidimicrobiales bacterium]